MSSGRRGAADPEADARWMRAALSYGARSLGEAAPNPAVGCVIIDSDGRLIGRGRTGAGGRPHGEALAIAKARAAAPDKLAGATAYVTLEPCAHHGKTPPCADALAAAAVARVVTALEDPDPRVSGQGHARLRAAGVEVHEGVLRAEAERAHAGHLLRVREQRPFVTLKLACSLDGRIATASGESQWITSPAARRRAHLLRAEHDAVMVGIGTALADDPRLNVRLAGFETRRPARVVLDSAARLPLASRLVQGVGPDGAVLVIHSPGAASERVDALRAAGVTPLAAQTDAQGRLDIQDAMRVVARAGVARVFCEGGGGVASSLLKAGLVDRLVIASAGIALGGDAYAAVAAMGLTRLADAPRLELADAWSDAGEQWSDWRRV